ncbi:hypothetical protein JVU11DRAFT_8799 [Chiua virens]|nr:hypothetical protein JVU11DRAFT_8799 [Chiua virens]
MDGPPLSFQHVQIPFLSIFNMISKHFISLLALMASVPFSYGLPTVTRDSGGIEIVYPGTYSPNGARVVWHGGETHNVQFNSYNMTSGTHRNVGIGWPDPSSPGYELVYVLAAKVDVTSPGAHHVEVTIPQNAQPGDQYRILIDTDLPNARYTSTPFTIA